MADLNAPYRDAERQLRDIDDEKKPGIRSDKIFFVYFKRQKIEGEHRRRSVGQHIEYPGYKPYGQRNNLIVLVEAQREPVQAEAQQTNGYDEPSHYGREGCVVYRSQ